MKRTHLPLNGLRVLDAAARHLSFTRAADELAVTPAAVGQQIRALEDMLGVVLFRRTPKGLELTPETEGALEALRGGFLMFEEAVHAMQAGQSSNALAIAAPRDISTAWLLPRLSAYASAHEELHFTLIAADTPPDFTEANLDLRSRCWRGWSPCAAAPACISAAPTSARCTIWPPKSRQRDGRGGGRPRHRIEVVLEPGNF
jgi:LysR family glycine cleavage system transcriptional activator